MALCQIVAQWLDANWVSAIATAFAVIIAALALFWSRIEHSWMNRRLQLSLRSPDTFAEMIDGVLRRYVHLHLINPTYLPVQNAEVFLTRVEFLEPDRRTFETGPIPLCWQYDLIEEESHSEANTHRKYRPRTLGTPRYCDIGYVTPRSDEFHWRTVFHVAGMPRSIRTRDMRIHLVAQGDNGQSQPLTIRIRWDGQWAIDDNEMSRHLRITSET